jgi:Amt family ammonium transporter
LISAALVLFMTPGLALFYGGMVRAKNVLAVIMQNFLCMALVTVLWALVGWTLAFGTDAGAASSAIWARSASAVAASGAASPASTGSTCRDWPSPSSS